MNLTKIFRRQLDLVKPKELEFAITIIGGGGIGSWAVFALAKMGCSNLTVVDFDKVEDKNIPSQLYKLSQVGQFKAEALKESIKDLTGVEIKTVTKKFQEYLQNGYASPKAIICAVDSMDERIDIWRALLAKWMEAPDMECYIDARMGGELLRILVVNPYDDNSLRYYEKKLFPSSKASKEPCTAKSIVYNTFICGGLIANLIKKYAKKEEVKFDLIFDIKNSMIL